jgi:predicted AAA+ superfamily ATPase
MVIQFIDGDCNRQPNAELFFYQNEVTEMAQSNYERIRQALELFNQALGPYIERELKAAFKGDWKAETLRYLPDHVPAEMAKINIGSWDTQMLGTVMWNAWNDVFFKTLGKTERNLLAEVRDIRNQWAHQQSFSGDDAYRALDTIERLLGAISAPQAMEIAKQKQDLLRQRFNEQARKSASKIEGSPSSGLKPWREVITPHPDVASGNFVQAEFAADLWQVYLGEGSSEYRDPAEFFRRTYITEGLRHLVVGALKRLSLNAGDPVIELQTNFGGGKTHSLLVLYHLFSKVPAGELAGIDEILSAEKLTIPKKVNRAVIVGNKIQPSEPGVKKDGTKINTLWGEIAWQLGGSEGYALLANADRTSTNPGDALKELFNRYAPCLILIDEWVAYARQLYTDHTLPAGTFDTQFTFAQTLSEAAKNARNTYLVVSVPASDNEIGGVGGREALNRLRNALGRVQSPWRPASAEEGFEIVRRRLFQPVSGKNHVALDATVRAFSQAYQSQPQDFPPECREGEYERRMKRAYPIHPELFDRLYNTWSTLDRFQRTRGVLRLMAKVIYSLWSKDDRNLLIMPASVPIDDPTVSSELTKFLEENWTPVIEQDVDGDSSVPRKLERDNPHLARYSAVRRVARTIYMGSAPLQQATSRGIDERSIKLGCVQPGEAISTFGDALRRLTDSATFLYVDNRRFWYSTQPTVRKTAEDRAAQLDEHDVWEEIHKRLNSQTRDSGELIRVHVAPKSGADVSDEWGCRLVILPPEQTHLAKVKDSPALTLAREILESRGTGPRMYKNTLAFLAADKSRLNDLEQAARHYLAWSSIVADRESLNLDAFQTKQAETQKGNWDQAVTMRIPETYQWLLLPEQSDPNGSAGWKQVRLQGQDALAVRASRKMISEEDLFVSMGGSRLRLEIDKIPLWRSEGRHVGLKQLVEDFTQYTYLPRLKNPEILTAAVEDGVSLLTWEKDSFAYADSWDEEAGRYRGLKAKQNVAVSVSSDAVIVKPEAALEQLKWEQKLEEQPVEPGKGLEPPEGTTEPEEPLPRKVTRFHGTVTIDPLRAGTNAGRISEEVIRHLSGLVGSDVQLTLEIQVEVPEGIPEDRQRIVNENCRTLKFRNFGFEEE